MLAQAQSRDLLATLRRVTGARYVLTGAGATRRFRKGYRYGDGPVLAVVRPASLIEQWRCLKACIEAGTIVICQAANTGLTGGSTPDGDDYDRPIVIINTLRIRAIDILAGGTQVVCRPGATLDQLEKTLRPIGREPHSVIGSTCIGASVTGGICNNSGGALIRRGPAYTQYALFARVDAAGRLELVNHLGIDLGRDPEEILGRLDRGDYTPQDVHDLVDRWASDRDYADHVRDIASPIPARFNADPRRHYEASGSAGKVAVFAVRLDTFPADDNTTVFYIGTNDEGELEAIRRYILGNFQTLPIAGRKSENCPDIERAICQLLDRRGAEYPAEHNVGHRYVAKPALRDFYRSLDPTNSFNPGIGHTSRKRDWQTGDRNCDMR